MDKRLFRAVESIKDAMNILIPEVDKGTTSFEDIGRVLAVLATAEVGCEFCLAEFKLDDGLTTSQNTVVFRCPRCHKELARIEFH